MAAPTRNDTFAAFIHEDEARSAARAALAAMTPKVDGRHHPLCSVQRGKACDYDCARDYAPHAQMPPKVEAPAADEVREFYADEWGCYSIGHDAHTGGHSSLSVKNRSSGEEVIFSKAEVLAALSTQQQPAADEVRELVEQLEQKAKYTSEISRSMAESKSLRQPDNQEGRTDLYSWVKPEDTTEGRAAAMLERLSHPTADAVAVERERCAQVAEGELENRRAVLKRSPFDNFIRGQINSADRILAAIRSGGAHGSS